MDYGNLFNYCKDISANLGVSTKFVHQDKAWLNLIEPNQPVTIWSLPFTSNITTSPNYNRTWTIPIAFYQQDKSDSSMDQNDTEKMQENIRTVAITDNIANTFIRQFAENDINEELSYASNLITVISASTETAVRDTAQQLTGTMVIITAEFADTFDYCCL